MGTVHTDVKTYQYNIRIVYNILYTYKKNG